MTLDNDYNSTIDQASASLSLKPSLINLLINRQVLKTRLVNNETLISSASLEKAKQALNEFKERSKDPDWLQAVIDYIDDCSVLKNPELLTGLQELKDGQLVSAEAKAANQED